MKSTTMILALLLPKSHVASLLCRSRMLHASAIPSSDSQSSIETIELVASDVDGTLLSSQGRLSSRTAAAIARVREAGIQFVPATGKCRAGALAALGETTGKALEKEPGVFTNGLQVYGSEAKLVWEASLLSELVAKVEEYAKQEGYSLVGYSGDCLLTTHADHRTDELHVRYMEPTPQVVTSLAGHAAVINKLLLLGSPRQLAASRSDVAALVGRDASLTVAMPQMLEVLPPGSTKGQGLSKLLHAMDVRAGAVVALGDAENDLEMLQLAGVGVAMGNALPRVTMAADLTTKTNDEDGAAIVLETLLDVDFSLTGFRAAMANTGE